jgi:hypothetical protein
MKVFSNQPLSVISDQNPSLLFTKVVIGSEKLERDDDPKRTNEEMVAFRYHINRTQAVGLREKLMKELEIKDKFSKTPLVLLLERDSGITNLPAVYDAMVAGCPFCNVTKVELDRLNDIEQVQLVSGASVLVGRHASDLAHVIWMRESRSEHPTHLVEITPYGYWCRPWYETAARVAGVQYHQVMNLKKPEAGALSQSCLSNARLCESSICHEALRNQGVTVEIATFNRTWAAVVESLGGK